MVVAGTGENIMAKETSEAAPKPGPKEKTDAASPEAFAAEAVMAEEITLEQRVLKLEEEVAAIKAILPPRQG